MTEPIKLQVGNDTFELDLASSDAPLIQRHFAKFTGRDLAIRNLPIPAKPLWLGIMVSAIRFYQKTLSPKLGNRCVFDPSCSHYSELAFRQKGFFKGLRLTMQRLKRCRPENGGVDELL